MAKKVLLVTGDGGESYETLYALHRFLEAGWEPAIAAPRRKRLHLVTHDFEPGWDTYVERPGYGVESNLTFEEVRAGDYEAVLLLGGRAPEYLRNDPRVIALVKEFHARGKGVFAICHGVQILVKAGLARGATMTCYEHLRPEIESAGGAFRAPQAVRDQNLITAQTWISHPEFYREIFAFLGGRGA